MLERSVERALVAGVKALGGKCIKIQGPGNRSMPDRLVILPFGWSCFVELKSPKGRVRADQWRMLESLNALGQRVAIIPSTDSVREFLAPHQWRKMKPCK